MKLTVQPKLDSKKDVLVLGIFQDDKDNYKSFHKDLARELADAQKRKSFSKKFGETYVTKLAGLSYYRVVVLGLGKKQDLTIEKVRRLCGKALKVVKGAKRSSFTTNLPEVIRSAKGMSEEALGRATAEALILANYDFVKYFAKEKREKRVPVASVALQWSKKEHNGFGKGLKSGRVIAESANFVRDLVNEPANVVNSPYLEKLARKVAASSSKLRLRVMNKAEMQKLGMGSLLGVNAGSDKPPKLLIMEYRGGKGKPTAFVGKGITFDSGGYNLKPTRHIEDMKTDMGGAAAVLGIMKALPQLGIKKNVLGVMPVCENMVSSTAQRPGDIVKAYNGKTIEIGNTDAEGRLILADSLAYVDDKYKPEIMVSMATLTGACVVALGYYAAGLMGKDDKLLEKLKEAGMNSGDRVWQLPFFEEYQDWMDGRISDFNNIGQKGKGYEGGSITAGVFLSKFVDKAKWAHLDIAGSAYWSVEGDYLKKGATGSGVRVLLYYLMGM